MTATITLADPARNRIHELRARANDPALNLRLTVDSGGCSGFSYKFSTDNNAKSDDHIFQNGDAALYVDEVSLPFLDGAIVNFVEDLMGSYFEVQNPNASSGCGCGTSFSI